MDCDNRGLVAEYARKAYKELRWAAANMAAIYELIRPADAPSLTDPNQLSLFDNDMEDNR